MTEQEKTDELISLIDKLCDANFAKDISTLDIWIEKLEKIYANGYRHTYSDIFYKVQSVISNNPDSEILEILGENLNELGKRLAELLSHNIDDANLQNASVSYKKFSDHIKLEIGRYNFIKSQFDIEIHPNDSNSKSTDIKHAEIDEINKKIDKVSAAVDNIRPVATEAKKQMDKLDDKLENNKISSITTLTIFSAVVLAFSGGITFEAGIFKGMVESSAYRLVFTIALTGFILFNTIFALLYLVGKMAGKTISTRCKYMSTDSEFPNITRRCGDGYCQKECNTVSLFCKILHKYSYVFVVNKCQESKILLQFKIQLIEKIISPNEELPFFYRIGQMMVDAFGSKSTNQLEDFLNKIRNEKVVTDKDYKKILRKLDDFVCQEIVKNNRLCTSISFRQHSQNKKKWKILKKEFREYLAVPKVN